jgi:hypothetical protein
LSNVYFDWPALPVPQRFVRFDTVRSEDVNNAFDLVSAGFEKIPSTDMLWGNRQNYAVAAGAVNAWTASLAPLYLTAYTDGMLIRVRFPHTNTTLTPTLNLNGLGARTIAGEGGIALQLGDIVANATLQLMYDATTGKFLISQNSLAAAAAAAASAASAAVFAAIATAAASGAAAGDGNWTERESSVDGNTWVVNGGLPITAVRHIFDNGRRQRLSEFSITLATGLVICNYPLNGIHKFDINWTA